VKKKSLKTIKKKAWTVFSEYIRKKYATKDGYVDCVTCNRVLPWNQMQAGHFIDGRNNTVLFCETGVHPQCMRCNIFLKGNKIEYYKFMQKNFGEEMIDELRFRAKQTKFYTTDQLEDMIILWKTAIKNWGI
jgi:hypothetical protein